MLKADQTKSIAESARNRIELDRNQIERELKAKKEFEEKSTQDFDKKLLKLFECALDGKTQYFFAEDEFVDVQLNMFSEAGFTASYHKAYRNKEASLRLKLDETRSILDGLINQLNDYPVILGNIFPGYMAAPSAFLNLLNAYWDSNQLSRYSTGPHLRGLLLECNQAWREELLEASSLLDQIVINFSRLKAIEMKIDRICSENKRIPKDIESGLLVSWGSSEDDFNLNNIILLSSAGLSWISSADGQLFIDKLEELILHEAHQGNQSVTWRLYFEESTHPLWGHKEQWSCDYFDNEEEDWVDNLGMVHNDMYVDDQGAVQYKGDEIISVPPPAVFAEILSLTGYKAEINWNPIPDEERGDDFWEATISISW